MAKVKVKKEEADEHKQRSRAVILKEAKIADYSAYTVAQEAHMKLLAAILEVLLDIRDGK